MDGGDVVGAPAVVVSVEPAGVQLVRASGESVPSAASRYGVRWPSVCGGHAECATCVVRVTAGQDGLPPVEEMEAATLARFPPRPDHVMRLACQLRPTAAVTLYRPGARPTVSPG